RINSNNRIINMKMKPHIRLRTVRGRAAVIITSLSLLGCHGPQPRHKLPPLGYVPLQGKLEQPLVDYMAKVPAGTRISIVVALKTNLTEADKRILFQAITTTNQID